jgi:hypothetical protein
MDGSSYGEKTFDQNQNGGLALHLLKPEISWTSSFYAGLVSVTLFWGIDDHANIVRLLVTLWDKTHQLFIPTHRRFKALVTLAAESSDI